MEYYWCLSNKYNDTTLYWKFDDFATYYDTKNILSEDDIIGIVKLALEHIELEYTGKYSINSFDPGNGHLLGVGKKLVIVEVSNGLIVVGPIWVSSPPEEMFKKVPTSYYKIG